MEKERQPIQGWVDNKVVSVDYSDTDMMIIDSIKQLSEPDTTRTLMNFVAIAKKGKAQVRLNNQTVIISAKQVLICPPNTVFTDFMFSPDFEFKALFLTTSLIQSFLREKMNIWNDMMYIHKLHVLTMQDRDIQFLSHFYDALRLLIEAPEDLYPYRKESIQALLRGAFLGLIGALETIAPATPKQELGLSASLFQRFLGLVNSGVSKSHNVESYASELCVSSKYLSVVCKKYSGKTANEWIRERVLEEVRYYLTQTDLSIKQIADRLGFANPSFFGKYVKEHFGVTPLQFRQRK